ncbi:MAG TPA: hypothetical protein VN715_08215 [Roseiarcus sp.]|nr:hypothetical protein [Roseiarcus sp.]
MSDEVLRNRTLRKRWLTDTFFDDFTAYQVIGANLTPMTLVMDKGIDFPRYATAWERSHSLLVDPSFEAAPVVDANLLVVGHIGWFSGRWYWAQKSGAGNLEGYLKQKIPVAVAATPSQVRAGWNQPFDDVTSYRVVTNPIGDVVAVVGFRDEAGLVSSWVTPLDFFIIGKAAIDLGEGGVKSLIQTLANSGANKAIVAATDELSEAGAKEGMALVKQIRAEGRPVIVNIGGAGEDAGAINLNPNKVAPRKDIPNHIARPAEEIDQIFDANSLDGMVSNRLPPNTLDWTKILPGLKTVLKPGAKLAIRFQGVGGDAKIIMDLLRSLGFRDINNFMNAAIEAVK